MVLRVSIGIAIRRGVDDADPPRVQSISTASRGFKEKTFPSSFEPFPANVPDETNVPANSSQIARDASADVSQHSEPRRPIIFVAHDMRLVLATSGICKRGCEWQIVE